VSRKFGNKSVHKDLKQVLRPTVFFLALLTVTTAWSLSGCRAEAFTAGRPAPEIAGGPWINSLPLTLSDLKGRVVLMEFWTYG
jgi:hypothetical protein